MTTTRVERWGTLGLALGLVLAGGPVRAAVGPAAKGASSAGAKGAGAKGAGAKGAGGSGEASSVQGEEEPGSGEGEGGESGESGEGEGVEGEGLPTDGLVLDPAEADRANAEQAYREGSDLYELGKYPEAIERFQRAWELSKEVQLLYNLGQAQWKWFDVDPDIDHLRQAALFFRNYDKRMRLVEGYDQVEIDNILKAIDAQIENEERKIAEANRPVIVQPGGPTEEELAWERRRRTTRALNISGTTIIVVGSVTLAAGLASLLTRVGYKLVLDTSSSNDGGINIASAEEDARRRSAYLTTGQVAFGTLISAAVILPVGIALRVTGAVREKQDRAKARERDEQRERNAQKAKVAVEPTLGGLRLRF